MKTNLLNFMLSQLSGNAKTLVNIQCASTCFQVNDVLTRKFSDQRNEVCFNRDLFILRQFHL